MTTMTMCRAGAAARDEDRVLEALGVGATLGGEKHCPPRIVGYPRMRAVTRRAGYGGGRAMLLGGVFSALFIRLKDMTRSTLDEMAVGARAGVGLRRGSSGSWRMVDGHSMAGCPSADRATCSRRCDGVMARPDASAMRCRGAGDRGGDRGGIAVHSTGFSGGGAGYRGPSYAVGGTVYFWSWLIRRCYLAAAAAAGRGLFLLRGGAAGWTGNEPTTGAEEIHS